MRKESIGLPGVPLSSLKQYTVLRHYDMSYGSQYGTCMLCVKDGHRLDADTFPGPAFHFDADPDLHPTFHLIPIRILSRVLHI